MSAGWKFDKEKGLFGVSVYLIKINYEVNSIQNVGMRCTKLNMILRIPKKKTWKKNRTRNRIISVFSMEKFNILLYT